MWRWKKNWFLRFTIENAWMEKNVVTNTELNLLLYNQLIDMIFQTEDNSESQEDESELRSQVSQREHMINKTLEIWINEEFEDDSENDKSIKEKMTKEIIKLKKTLLNISNQSLQSVPVYPEQNILRMAVFGLHIRLPQYFN